MTYEYLCTACSNAWEAEQSISEAPLKICPRCHKETAKRQVSGGAGFILKGGGWYSDLYGSAPKKSESSSESSNAEAKPAGDAKKSDTSSTGTNASSKESSTGSGGSDGTTKGTSSGSGSKGGADSSAA